MSPLRCIVVLLQDAIKHDSYYSDFGMSLEAGNVAEVLNSLEPENILSGSLKIGGQEHFYMETQGCLAIPKKDGEMELISSSQYPSEVQVGYNAKTLSNSCYPYQTCYIQYIFMTSIKLRTSWASLQTGSL